jgi:RHS repeat-associated protein
VAPCGGTGGSGGAGGQASGGANTGASTSVSTTSSTSATTGAGAGGESVTTSSVTTGVTTSASVTTGAGAAGGFAGTGGTGGAGTGGAGTGGAGTGGAGTGGGTGGTGGTGGADPCAVAIVDDGDPCTIDTCANGVVHRYVCDALDPSGSVTATDLWAYLYSGPDPIQTGVAPGTIAFHSAALVQGHVRLPNGDAAPNANVTVLGHPELGVTRTDVSGDFRLVVNGGQALNIDVRLPGYLRVQRQVQPTWQSTSSAADIVLTAPDPSPTFVDLPAITEVTAVEGSLVSDARGTRQGTALVTPGTTAVMRFADGTTAPLAAMTLRITEVTVGPDGPAKMPAELPPSSAYTFAYEMAADEAVAAGADHLDFSQPVLYFVDNFLGVAVGTLVPAGTYEPARGVWLGELPATVIAIVDTSGGIAAIDADGDGLADSDAALAALGLDLAQREKLATLYVAGTELTFAAFTHASLRDYNFSAGPDLDATDPNLKLAFGGSTPCTETKPGSIIECNNQSLGETIDVPGTPYTLSYRSRLAAGTRARTDKVKLPLTGDSVPASLKKIRVEVEVAGRIFQRNETCPCAPNSSWTFQFDGLDSAGRELEASTPAEYRIHYDFKIIQYTTMAERIAVFDKWGQYPVISDVDGGRAFTRTQRIPFTIGHHHATSQGLGGFTLDAVHALDLDRYTIHYGDGQFRTVEPLQLQVKPVYSGHGGVFDLAFLPDGAMVVVIATPGYSGTRHSIVRVEADGTETYLFGAPTCTSQAYSAPVAADVCGDLTLRTIAVGPDGTIYFTEDHTVHAVTPDGRLLHIAGNGSLPSGVDQGDGGLATDAPLGTVSNVAATPSGRVYFLHHTVVQNALVATLRSVDPGGVLDTAARGTGLLPPGSTGPIAQVALGDVTDLAAERDGSLLVAAYVGGDVVKWSRISPDGLIRPVAGGGVVPNADGISALQAKLDRGGRIASDGEGGFYLVNPLGGSQGPTIKRVGSDGIIHAVAGKFVSINPVNVGVPGPAGGAELTSITRLAHSPDGHLYFASGGIMRLESYVPGIEVGSALFPTFVSSEDGREVYIFDRRGRHTETRDAQTGTVLLRIGRDAASHVVSLTDENDLVTVIERDAQGEPTAIVGPYGHRTELVIGSSGLLEQVIDPSGAVTEMTYEPGGLMATFTNQNGHTASFQYDPDGRLVHHEDAAGSDTTLDRADLEIGEDVTFTSPLGRQTRAQRSYDDQNVETRTTTNEAGLTVTNTRDKAEHHVSTSPDGTVVAMDLAADPRFAMLAPVVAKSTVTLPSGLTRTTTNARTATLSNSLDPLSLVSRTDTTTVDGRTWTRNYNVATRLETMTTPEGRISQVRYDAKGRVAEMQYPDTLPISLSYDPQGRLLSTVQGTRSTTRTYGLDGLLASATDPLSQTTLFGRDLNGRVIAETRPDLEVTSFSYDAEGKTVGVTPPGRDEHGMTYNNVDILSAYEPPLLGTVATPTTYSYNPDKMLEQVVQPGARVIDYTHDFAGRLETTTFPTGVISREYDAATGQLAALRGPTGVDLAFEYDGKLMTSMTWSGAVTGSVEWAYDTSFRVVTETVNGAWSAAFAYDDDDLLLQAGALTMFRDPESGRLTGTTAGSVSDTWSYNDYGEPSAYAATVAGNALLAFAYERDDLGRITKKTETRGGVSRVIDYGYDLAGRLETVTEDGELTESYGYDANGNRTSSMNSAGVVTATYDAQDRIETSGDYVFGFTENGELASKLDTSNGDLTTYEYDALGNLRGVVLPDGTEITYLVDGRGRRVGRVVDGVLERAWIWRKKLQPVAELDASGNVVARYVYAGGANVPELMVTATGTYRLVKDHLGSVRAVVDVATGAVAQELAYDSWGRVLVDTNPGFQPFGFAGGLYDADTGLVRFGARDYEAETGRWTAKDPKRFDGGVNLNGYADGDPVNRTDPTGQDAGTDLLVGPIGGAILDKLLGPGPAPVPPPAPGLGLPPAPFIGVCAGLFAFFYDESSISCGENESCADSPGPAGPDEGCLKSCYNQYEIRNVRCRNLGTAARRNKCWRESAAALANCQANC